MKFLHSLQWRIAMAYTVLIFFSMGAVSLYLINFVRDSYISDLQVRLEHEAALAAQAASPYLLRAEAIPELRALAERIGNAVESRVTIISTDGSVLADTWEDPRSMENHGGRPEVQAALRDGAGTGVRFSATVGQEMLYMAVPIQSAGVNVGVARVAVPTSQIQSNVNRIIATVLASSLIVALFSIALGYFLADRTSRSVRSVTQGALRLAEGDLDHRVRSLAPDETQELADAFNRMAAALKVMVRDLSDERNKLSAILNTMADGVVVVARDGTITLLNQATEQLLDVKARQAVGARFMDVFRDHDLQRLVSQSLETRAPHQGEAELLHPRRFLSAVATPLFENGAVGVLLTLHDLTKVRQVETTRREFVSNVSHELRTPLASVKAMVETLLEGAMEDRAVAKDFLRRVEGDVDRMSGMVNELLELSRLESGQAVLTLAPLDLAHLVNETKQQLFPRAESKGISIELDIPPGLPQVIGEVDKLRQVLQNLLDNAIKFTPEKGLVTVSAAVVGEYVEVRVQDTGIGVAPEHLPHVFERFFKAERSRRDGGAGLGLAIVKHIVQAHGGQVRVESREGEGATFAFTVPRAG